MSYNTDTVNLAKQLPLVLFIARAFMHWPSDFSILLYLGVLNNNNLHI